MSQVRVYNDNIYPFKQNFKDEEIHIPAGGFVMMSPADAVIFRGSYSPMMKGANGQPDPKFFKKIRVEEIGAPEPERKKYICQFDGKEFQTEEALEAYIDENHIDKIADQEFAQKRKAGRPKKVV